MAKRVVLTFSDLMEQLLILNLMEKLEKAYSFNGEIVKETRMKCTSYTFYVYKQYLLQSLTLMLQLDSSIFLDRKRPTKLTHSLILIDISDGIGKEIVLLVDTDVKNGDVFYTDSNGLEL